MSTRKLIQTDGNTRETHSQHMHTEDINYIYKSMLVTDWLNNEKILIPTAVYNHQRLIWKWTDR